MACIVSLCYIVLVASFECIQHQYHVKVTPLSLLSVRLLNSSSDIVVERAKGVH